MDQIVLSVQGLVCSISVFCRVSLPTFLQLDPILAARTEIQVQYLFLLLGRVLVLRRNTEKKNEEILVSGG